MFAFDELFIIFQTFWGGGELLTGMEFPTKGSVAKEGVLIHLEGVLIHLDCFLH